MISLSIIKNGNHEIQVYSVKIP